MLFADAVVLPNFLSKDINNKLSQDFLLTIDENKINDSLKLAIIKHGILNLGDVLITGSGVENISLIIHLNLISSLRDRQDKLIKLCNIIYKCLHFANSLGCKNLILPFIGLEYHISLEIISQASAHACMSFQSKHKFANNLRDIQFYNTDWNICKCFCKHFQKTLKDDMNNYTNKMPTNEKSKNKSFDLNAYPQECETPVAPTDDERRKCLLDLNTHKFDTAEIKIKLPVTILKLEIDYKDDGQIHERVFEIKYANDLKLVVTNLPIKEAQLDAIVVMDTLNQFEIPSQTVEICLEMDMDELQKSLNFITKNIDPAPGVAITTKAGKLEGKFAMHVKLPDFCETNSLKLFYSILSLIYSCLYDANLYVCKSIILPAIGKEYGISMKLLGECAAVAINLFQQKNANKKNLKKIAISILDRKDSQDFCKNLKSYLLIETKKLEKAIQLTADKAKKEKCVEADKKPDEVVCSNTQQSFIVNFLVLENALDCLSEIKKAKKNVWNNLDNLLVEYNHESFGAELNKAMNIPRTKIAKSQVHQIDECRMNNQLLLESPSGNLEMIFLMKNLVETSCDVVVILDCANILTLQTYLPLVWIGQEAIHKQYNQYMENNEMLIPGVPILINTNNQLHVKFILHLVVPQVLPKCEFNQKMELERTFLNIFTAANNEKNSSIMLPFLGSDSDYSLEVIAEAFICASVCFRKITETIFLKEFHFYSSWDQECKFFCGYLKQILLEMNGNVRIHMDSNTHIS